MLTWDSKIVPKSEQWSIKSASRSGGQSLTGSEQIVASPAGRWSAKLSFDLYIENTLAVEAFIASLSGRATPFLIGPIDLRSRPVRAGVMPQNDARLFLTPGGGLLNGVALNVLRQVGGPILPGHLFSVDGRMHRILTVSGDDGRAGTTFAITFRPWLRANVAAGSFLNFENPTCTMRLASDDVGDVERSISPVSQFSLDLVEAF